MSTVAMPRSAASATKRSTIAFCVVTSRPVVGSSAINRRGLQASAIAIIARWHMPPDNSNGYDQNRRAGSWMRTWPRSSTADTAA